VIGYPQGPIFLSLVVAFFTVVTTGHRLAAILGLAAGYFGFLWLRYLLDREPAPSLGAILGLAAWLLVLFSAAEFVRVRRERALEAVRIREEQARRRASEERLRMARELHDALGHHISLINVRAGVALHLNEELPEQARSALDAIRQASKEALTELRSVLDILRQSDEQASWSPTPTPRRAGQPHLPGCRCGAGGPDRDCWRGSSLGIWGRRGSVSDRAGGANERCSPRRPGHGDRPDRLWTARPDRSGR
jgi:histidine kinase